MLMDDNHRVFYEHHAVMMEPWGGPAAICFTDGHQIDTTLDRNGLRPARYYVTDDDMAMMASKAGVLPAPESRIVKKQCLQPGKVSLIGMEQGHITDGKKFKDNLADTKPYKNWIGVVRIKLDELGVKPENVAAETKLAAKLLDRQQAFAYTRENIKLLMAPMAVNSEEVAGSMDNDSPLAVLFSKNKTFHNYFKQLSAQITNPSTGPIRENVVISLASFIGPRPSLLELNNINPSVRLEVSRPVLDFKDMTRVHNIEHYIGGELMAYELDICYPVAWGKEGVEARLASLCVEVIDAVKSGYNILIVLDRAVDGRQAAISALLATFAIHYRLVDRGLHTNTGLIVEIGPAREVHHFALLAGYDAEAVHPYLAMETLVELAPSLDLTAEKTIYSSTKAIGKGLYEIMPKMGISAYMSYTSAQIFEAIDLSRELIDKYFQGIASNMGDTGISEMAEEAPCLHRDAFGDASVLANMLDAGGEYAYHIRGEKYMWTLDSIAKLQHATRASSYQTYKKYANLVDDRSKHHMTLCGLFEFKMDPARAILLEEIEPAKETVKRFVTGTMSLDSISTETYTTLAATMDHIGGKSNMGEGSEDECRHHNELCDIPIEQGTKLSDVIGREVVERNLELQGDDSLRSKVRQVTLGRPGVMARCLASADQIQAKMAQGAKSSGGGQLPGHKMADYIGKLRYAVPGVGLISPPSYHDIYLVEDLTQLIHDLKNVNPRSDVPVKLVSGVGVGTVAAGVAEVKADYVVIAGHDDGTGASPWSLIKHVGTLWELDLVETQQTLIFNGLCDCIRVQADGQMRIGRDIVVGTLLGTDKFGFATAPLAVEGCIMMRKCHLNTCPMGVATQDSVLCKKFLGGPERAVNYFFSVAEEVREIMTQLGVRTFNKLISRANLLDMKTGIEHWRARGLDFTRIFYQSARKEGEPRYQVDVQGHGLDRALGHQLIEKSKAALEKGEHASFTQPVCSVNHTADAMLSKEIAKRCDCKGLPDDSIHAQMQGTVGQSLGAFLAYGITLGLVDDGNDHVDKGLSGGRVIVRPPHEFRGESTNNIIVGSTVLYDAPADEAFFNNVADKRFAVRNSGATTVVESTGDHGCEYMTDGTVVVLGTTGRNSAAGMPGGVAYAYDEDGLSDKRYNMAMVTLESVLSVTNQEKVHTPSTQYKVNGECVLDEQLLKASVEKHFRYIGPERTKELLIDWDNACHRFIKVFPTEYKRALAGMYERGQKADREQIAA